MILDPIIEKILNFKKKDIPKYEKNLMVAGSTPGINLVKGKGIYAWDIEGNKYIDCTSQAYTLSLGYSHPEIVKIAQEHQIPVTQNIPLARTLFKTVEIDQEIPCIRLLQAA